MDDEHQVCTPADFVQVDKGHLDGADSSLSTNKSNNNFTDDSSNDEEDNSSENEDNRLSDTDDDGKDQNDTIIEDNQHDDNKNEEEEEAEQIAEDEAEEEEHFSFAENQPFQQRLVQKYIRDHIAYHTETDFQPSTSDIAYLNRLVEKNKYATPVSTSLSLLSFIWNLLNKYLHLDTSQNLWIKWIVNYIQPLLPASSPAITNDQFLKDYLAVEEYRHNLYKFQNVKAHKQASNMLLPNYQYQMITSQLRSE